MLYSLALIIIIFSQFFYSCGSGNDGAEPTLSGEKWKLVKITDRNKSEHKIDKPGDYTLKLSDNGSFKVLSDCNKCSGKYTTASKFIKFKKLECTKKICGKASQDFIFRKSLKNATSFKLKNRKLTLGSYKSTMEFSTE